MTGRRRIRFLLLTAGLYLAGGLFHAQPISPAGTQKVRPGNPPAEGSGSGPGQEGERVRYRTAEYIIKARVPVLGDLGPVGTFAIEEEVRRNGGFLDTYFRILGASKPDLAKKGKDYRGQLEIVHRDCPGIEPGGDGAEAGAMAPPVRWSSGFFNKNGSVESESITFFGDHALSLREGNRETQVEGAHGCLISAFEHFLKVDIREGDIVESSFVLGGHPFRFRCEVGRPTIINPPGVRAYPIDFTTYDGVERDGTGRLKVVKKKGSIRLWVCKEEPYKDVYLRLAIQYKWYLSIQMELVRCDRPAPLEPGGFSAADANEWLICPAACHGEPFVEGSKGEPPPFVCRGTFKDKLFGINPPCPLGNQGGQRLVPL
jgi:hypothetical protein